MKRAIFIVHALSPAHRMLLGLRGRRWSLLGDSDRKSLQDIVSICRFRYRDEVEVEVVALPQTAEELIADQEQALRWMLRAVEVARSRGELGAIGLGSVCAIVAGRGTALQARTNIPVTTGGAATVWTLVENVKLLAQQRQQPLLILGAQSPVGKCVSQILVNQGHCLRVDHKRTAKKLDLSVWNTEQINGHIVVGCATTGPTINAERIGAECAVIDVALPESVEGPLPADCQVWMGETLTMPKQWRRGFWGPIYHLGSGYGFSTVLACLLEPLAIVLSGRSTAYAQGRSCDPDAVVEVGKVLCEAGFQPHRRLLNRA